MTALRDAQFYLRSMRAVLAMAQNGDDPQRLSEVSDLAALLDSKLIEAMREEAEREDRRECAEHHVHRSEVMRAARRRA